MRQLSPTDAAWLLMESRDTPMHVGGLYEFDLPDGASPTFLRDRIASWMQQRAVPAPWNLRLSSAPLVGARLPVMSTVRDVDLGYHVRHLALPQPGGQRELGILVSRLHSHQLDLRRPLWEAHFIEGLEDGRFAMYMKLHHALIDGMSGVRLTLDSLSRDPAGEATPFWLVPKPYAPSQSGDGRELLRGMRDLVDTATGLGRAAADLALAAFDSRPLSAPYRSPDSVLHARLTGQRRFATQQYELGRVRELARAAGSTVNDVVLWLCGTALRRYLDEQGLLPDRPLTAVVPVSLRPPDDRRAGNAIASIVSELGTDVADPWERLMAIRASTAAGKRHLDQLPESALGLYLVFVNGPYFAGLSLGLADRAPVPASIAVSNLPGPPEPLYLDAARLTAIYPISLLAHGTALNITCVSYDGTLNFGFTGARDALPHLQRLAVFTGAALDELDALVRARA